MRLPVIHKVDTRSLIHAGEDPQILEARRRAGTLMGGETAGAQGEVQIWAPSKKWIRLQVTLDVLECLFFLAALGMVYLHPKGLAIFAIASLMIVFMVSTHIRHPYRPSINAYQIKPPPCYISTDGVGIAFVQWSNSLSLSWGEVIALHRVRTHLSLYTRTHGTEGMSLDGFAPKDIEKLEALICSRSSLIYRPVFGFYTRRGETLESLRAARDGKDLPEPAGERHPDSSGGPGTDESGSRT